MEIMNYEHPRWQEFLSRLEGPEGCNFRIMEEDEFIAADWMWDCDNQSNKPLATAILKDMGNIDIPTSMEFFNKHGGYCDCEILFNVASKGGQMISDSDVVDALIEFSRNKFDKLIEALREAKQDYKDGVGPESDFEE